MSFPIQSWNAQAESLLYMRRHWQNMNSEHWMIRPAFSSDPLVDFSQHSKPFYLHLLHPFYLSGVPSQTQMIWPHILTAQEHISVTTITTLSVMKSINYSCAFVRWFEMISIQNIVLSCWLERCRLWDGMIPDDISEPSWRATQLQVKPGSREGAYHHLQCPAFEFQTQQTHQTSK